MALSRLVQGQSPFPFPAPPPRKKRDASSATGTQGYMVTLSLEKQEPTDK